MPGQVTVACKVPNGVLLRLFKMVPSSEPVLGGGRRETTIAEVIAAPVKIHGPARPFGADPVALVVGGYALTPNVDADFFAEWMRQNADHDMVKNNLIFAHEKRDTVEKKAEDRSEVLSGLQPMDMSMVQKGTQIVAKDARIPRSKGLRVETAKLTDGP